MKPVTKTLLTLILASITLLANSEAMLKLDTLGHTAKISDLIVTQSGDIITASDDKTIRVWDSKTGKEKRKILGQIGKGSEGKIYAIALSPDQKYLAVGGFLDKDENYQTDRREESIRIYNYTTGKLVKAIKAHKGSILDLSFSSDSKYLISGSTDTRVKIWQVEKDFSLFDTIKTHTKKVNAVKIIKKNSNYYAVTAGFDNRISIYDMQKRKEKYSDKKGYSLHSLAISDKHIAVSGLGSELSGKLGGIFGGGLGGGLSGEIQIYDYKLNKVKTIITTTVPWGLNYSPNGEFLIAGTAANIIHINIYSVSENYKSKSMFLHHRNLAMAVNFLDNKTAVTAGGNRNEIYSWDIDTSEIKKKIVGVGDTIWSVGIKGDNIAWGNIDDCKQKNCSSLRKSLNLKTMQIESNKEKVKQKKYKRIATKKGNLTLTHKRGGSYGYTDAILVLKKGKSTVAKMTKNDKNGYQHRCYGFYKNYIISGGTTGDIKIYNFKGKEIANLTGHTGEVWSIALDGDRLISGSGDQTIKIWDLSTLESGNKKLYPILNIFVSKNNEKSTSLKIVSIKDNSIAKKSGLKVGDIIYGINNEVFSSREEYLRYVKSLKTYLYNIIRDNKKITIKINKSKNLIGFDFQMTPQLSKSNEWITWTNEGFFNASKNGAQYIGYHINQGRDKEAEFVTVESLYNTFYRPDLIKKALNGESLKKYAKNINIEKLLKDGLAPEVHILTKAQTTKNENLKLKVQVCPKGNGGYDNLTLLIDNVPISITDTSRAIMRKQKSKRDDCFVYNQIISLQSGENEIGFKATNKAGNMASKVDNISVIFDDKELKAKLKSRLTSISGNQNINDLHILAIAVNNYKDNELKLKYSLNDADKIIKTVQKVAKPIFKKVHTYRLLDENVTKEKIKAIFSQIKSTREDVFLLYIAGHGVTDEYNGNYYYIPYDFVNSDDIASVQTQGIGQKDLLSGLSGITALKSLILLDTCESGSFVEANMLKTTTNRLAKATGRATISASGKSQVALEGFEGHGVFTYTLLEALRGKGYKDDNKITVNELSDYVEDILPKRTYEKWKYRQKPQSSMYGMDFNIGGL